MHFTKTFGTAIISAALLATSSISVPISHQISHESEKLNLTQLLEGTDKTTNNFA